MSENSYITINEYGQVFRETFIQGVRRGKEIRKEDLWVNLESFGLLPAKVDKRVMELESFFCAVRGLASFFLERDKPRIDLFLEKFDKMLEKVGLGDDD